MADPVTWAIVLSAAGAGTAAVGTFQQARARATQAESEKNIARFNAALASRQAGEEEARSALAQQIQSRESEREASALRAQLGVSGAVIGEGAPLRLQVEQAEQAELRNLLIGYEGQIAASRARSQADILQAQSGLFGKQARAARVAAPIGAGASLLTGFGQVATIRAATKK